jgi:branched-chain amino acid transport system permease protein
MLENKIQTKKEQKLWVYVNTGLRSLGLTPLFLFFILVLALAPLFIEDAYLRRLLVVSLFFGTLAMAFDFTGGFINAVNFGFAGFVGLGAYISALTAINTTLNPWIGLLLAAIGSAVVGFLTGLLTLPLRGIYVSLMSWFVGMTLMALATAMENVTHGSRGLVVPVFSENITIIGYLYLLIGIMVAMYIILHLIIHSRIGLAFRAIGQSFDAARASGVNPTQYKLLNFTISCASAGLLGGFYSHFVGIVTPDLMDTNYTMEVMALSFIGGSGSLVGGFFAAFLLIPIFDSLKKLMEYRLVIYGLLLIFVMIFYPNGLSGLYEWVLQIFQKRKGKS